MVMPFVTEMPVIVKVQLVGHRICAVIVFAGVSEHGFKAGEVGTFL